MDGQNIAAGLYAGIDAELFLGTERQCPNIEAGGCHFAGHEQ